MRAVTALLTLLRTGVGAVAQELPRAPLPVPSDEQDVVHEVARKAGESLALAAARRPRSPLAHLSK